MGLLASACGDTLEPLVIARCTSDAECGEGKVCEVGECKPKDAVSCNTVQGGMAILQPGPPLLEFGEVADATYFQSLTLRNIGNCTLTLFEARFEAEAASPFECPGCTPDLFPLELFPFREKEIEIAFTPTAVGEFKDNLVLLSDDAEYPEIKVPVRARFVGVPNPSVIPNELEFGYVQVGRTITKEVKISNRGTGTAKLVVSHIEIMPTGTTAYSLVDELTAPVEILPLSQDQNAGYVVKVSYHPREVGLNNADLVITTNLPRNGIIHVPLHGSSQTPAKISVSPPEIRFGDVPIGRTNALPLTIVNEGGSPLEVHYRWGGTGLSTDLSASPALVPLVQAGNYSELQVFVTATAPAPITGLLILDTNDPLHPTVTVPVSADGQDVAGAQVVKLEMNFENGQNGFFDNDFRNVDMTLENPFGLVCNKQNPNPTNWGNFGTSSWVSLGPTEEPERIVLFGAMADGTYRVMVNYIEDCSSLPSGILSAILGISIDVILTGIIGAPIGVSPGQISDAIDSICFSHDSSAVTITVSVNGMIIKEATTSLSRKGDYQYPVELIRQNGQFMVR
ncbi:MAG: choice-of-anchor D domain-containing protein [Myxococcota bacterium]